MILQDLPTLKCSEQTSVPAAIVYSLPSSQRIPWIHYFPIDADVGQFLSLLLAFKNTKISRHSEIKQTRFFSGSFVKTKHRGLTSLTFMQLVPGDDRMVRHICIRCMDPLFSLRRKRWDNFYPFWWHSRTQKLVGIAR